VIKHLDGREITI